METPQPVAAVKKKSSAKKSSKSAAEPVTTFEGFRDAVIELAKDDYIGVERLAREVPRWARTSTDEQLEAWAKVCGANFQSRTLSLIAIERVAQNKTASAKRFMALAEKTRSKKGYDERT